MGILGARLLCIVLRRCVALVCLGFCLVTPVSGEAAREYQLKAVLLWRFAQFTEWPTNAFEKPESPIIIGILGKNPFDRAVETVVAEETAHDRRLVVRYFNRVEEIKDCHILYICESQAPRLPQIIAALSNRSILTVSEIDQFARSHKGMVRLINEDNKIQFRINLGSVKAARLVLDPRLLRMAEIVPGKVAHVIQANLH